MYDLIILTMVPEAVGLPLDVHQIIHNYVRPHWTTRDKGRPCSFFGGFVHTKSGISKQMK